MYSKACSGQGTVEGRVYVYLEIYRYHRENILFKGSLITVSGYKIFEDSGFILHVAASVKLIPISTPH